MSPSAHHRTHLTPRSLALDLGIHPAVYEPAEDSFLLAKALAPPSPTPAKSLEGVRLLDLGCGGGLVGLWTALQGARVTAVDLNPHAVELTLANAMRLGLKERLEAYLGHLFQALPENTAGFDIIACNPPYLPADPHRRTGRPRPREAHETAHWQAVALESGTDGAEAARRVLREAPGWLRRSSASLSSASLPPSPSQPSQRGLYLLVSSLTKLNEDDWQGWRTGTVERQAVGPYEELRVHRGWPVSL